MKTSNLWYNKVRVTIWRFYGDFVKSLYMEILCRFCESAIGDTCVNFVDLA